jgi:transposase
MRELKGLEIAARCKITFDGVHWIVPSQTTSGDKYKIKLTPEGDSCTCDDFGLTAKPCKHVHAARIVRQRDHGGEKAPIIDTDVVPKRPTYKQDWSSYNLAQTTEKHRLQVLLADLCAGIPERPYAGTGRKAVPAADRLFVCAFKVYSTLSSRRFGCDLKDATERGYVSRPLHISKINCFMCDPEMTPLLHELVRRSALPLRMVETTFAPDSTGFSTSKFVRWYDQKYGVERAEHDWVKAHIMTGTKTNVVTAVRIEGRDAADCPQLVPLLKTTTENFKVDELSADKAYLSVENVEAIAEGGGEPFIAPKVNTTGAAGGLFEKMFHYYQFRREEFLKHYHQRSNVESTISAVKRKFGDAVRSHNDVAMTNEVLCKFLCNNLCYVILSQIELGIEAVFWDNGEEPARDVLPLVRPG